MKILFIKFVQYFVVKLVHLVQLLCPAFISKILGFLWLSLFRSVMPFCDRLDVHERWVFFISSFCMPFGVAFGLDLFVDGSFNAFLNALGWFFSWDEPFFGPGKGRGLLAHALNDIGESLTTLASQSEDIKPPVDTFAFPKEMQEPKKVEVAPPVILEDPNAWKGRATIYFLGFVVWVVVVIIVGPPKG